MKSKFVIAALTGLLLAGAELLVMYHPDAVKVMKKTISQLMGAG